MGDNTARVTKRARVRKFDDDTIATVWSHYRSYTDGDGGDVDDLIEILDILRNDDGKWNLGSYCTIIKPTTCAMLLPVLVSVCCTVLADDAIAALLVAPEKISDKDDDDDHQRRQYQAENSGVSDYMDTALKCFPENAAAWSMLVNFRRMTSPVAAPGDLAHGYAHAATYAAAVRTAAIAFTEDSTIPEDCKEWIELLLLNQVTGVELELLRSAHDDKHNDTHADGNNDVDDDGDGEEERWSASAVEGTARFMAAMLFSIADQHKQAANQLHFFPRLTHRLHPNVWNVSNASFVLDENKAKDAESAPVSFRLPSGILPTAVYKRMCRVFAPNAPYWRESGYSNRGYYSYFMDVPKAAKSGKCRIAASNLVEDVVCNNLLPLARQHLGDAMSDKIVGYEWWVHQRPIAANLGHNLHFDTDEALLAQDRLVTHPIVSSVLYLTGGSQAMKGGPTIVLNQNSDATRNANKAWVSRPLDNSFMVFPGNLLHGVLPCRGHPVSSALRERSYTSDAYSNSELLCALGRSPEVHVPMSGSRFTDESHRLTFMVGFWTRRVPDRMKVRKLYGPCSPLPCTESASWVKDMQEGYNDRTNMNDLECEMKATAMPLPCISPAWDEVNSDVHRSATKENPELVIPRSIDHRYFVSNAPQCFRDSLFEKDPDPELDKLLSDSDSLDE